MYKSLEKHRERNELINTFFQLTESFVDTTVNLSFFLYRWYLNYRKPKNSFSSFVKIAALKSRWPLNGLIKVPKAETEFAAKMQARILFLILQTLITLSNGLPTVDTSLSSHRDPKCK